MQEGQFSGYLSSAFPSQIVVDVSEFCNLKCIHCPYETVTKIKGNKRQNLDESLHTKLIDEIAGDDAGACRFLRYTGDGEPLLHPRLPQMLAYAVERTRLPVNVTTNGLLLNEERARALVESGVSVFDISLDAHRPETYAQVRVGGDLATAHANVIGLIDLIRRTGSQAKVVVSFVHQPLNEGEADDFTSFWTQKGVSRVVIRQRHSCAGSVSDVARSMWENAPSPRKPCLYPWERLVVKPDGKITFCPADWMHEGEVGNLAIHSIRDVWQGSAMSALRTAHLSKDFSRHAFCGKCPDWSAIPWPEQKRSYATMMHDFEKAAATEEQGLLQVSG